jgi:hypothetical protein
MSQPDDATAAPVRRMLKRTTATLSTPADSTSVAAAASSVLAAVAAVPVAPVRILRPVGSARPVNVSGSPSMSPSASPPPVDAGWDLSDLIAQYGTTAAAEDDEEDDADEDEAGGAEEEEENIEAQEEMEIEAVQAAPRNSARGQLFKEQQESEPRTVSFGSSDRERSVRVLLISSFYHSVLTTVCFLAFFCFQSRSKHSLPGQHAPLYTFAQRASGTCESSSARM